MKTPRNPWYNLFYLAAFIFFLAPNNGCIVKSNAPKATYKTITPDYNAAGMQTTSDTLNFYLDSTTYSSIKSMNIIRHNQQDYFVFFDDRSTAISFFELGTQLLTKKIVLKDIFPLNVLSKTSILVKSYDSIFLGTRHCIYLLDSNGVQKDSIPLRRDPYAIRVYFKNTWPALVRNDTLYVGIEAAGAEVEPEQIKEKYIIYAFNMKTRESSLLYGFPPIYLKDFYGYNFLRYGYCLNDKGNAVFSFPADSNVYETDLRNSNNAYLGKSKHLEGYIPPINARNARFKYDLDSFEVRNSYGPIYYDNFNKRYLRIAMNGLPPNATRQKKKKKQHLIIMNDDFKIIGESELDDEINPSYTFFTSDGRMYTRTLLRDDNALHFVKLIYK